MIEMLLGNWQRIALYAVVILFALSTAAGIGYHRGVKQLWDYQVEQAQESVKVIVKQGEATERIVTKFVKVQGEARVITTTIEREVVKYADSNPGSCLDAAWGRLHDAAASRTVPEAPSPADGTAGAPKASAALETTTGNYAACHRNADRLDALQEWVKAQASL